MCGIFAYKGNKNNAGDLILEGLKTLEYRGYDSWGLAVKESSGQIYLKKEVGKIGTSKIEHLTSTIGFGHTRWATHGGVTKNNSHPHSDCKNKVLVVHNGIVENYSTIKNILLTKGHVFKSETDTEVIAHLIEEKLKNNKNRAQVIFDTFNQVTGMNALIVFLPEFEEFYAIKNGSPIVFGQSKNNSHKPEYIIASDASALIPYTNQVFFLEDDQLLLIDKQAKLYDQDMKSLKLKFTKLEFTKGSTALGRFAHFMIKEIHEQPQIITNIVNTQKNSIEHIAKLIKNSYGSYFIGCGTAYYAALTGAYLFAKIANRHINDSVGSEFSYFSNFLNNKSLVIAISQSGETIDIISSLKKVRSKKSKIISITNGLGSTLYRMSDYKILLNAGPEKCVLATKSFTAKIAIIYLIAYTLNGGYQKGINHLKKAVLEVDRLIDSPQIKKLATKLKESRNIFVLGRGVSYPTALESALKIKEVCYIHAEGFAGGELKHGVIALVDKGTPVIVYNPEDETYEDTLSSAHEVKARGAYLIGISSKNNPIYDDFIRVGNCQDATIIPNVVVAQLLGYYLALAKNLDPDKPRNLAKSVTVK